MIHSSISPKNTKKNKKTHFLVKKKGQNSLNVKWVFERVMEHDYEETLLLLL